MVGAAGLISGLMLAGPLQGSVTPVNVIVPAAQLHALFPPVTRSPAEASPVQAARIYIVRSGDTLSGIAQDQCGTSADWNALWGANKTAISNPGTIFPGERIIIAC
jgi:nucleoid-associated protein YgaU